MGSNDSLDHEMERTLRDYFAAESGRLRAPADTWVRLERRLGQPRPGWFGGGTAGMWRVLTAAAGTAVASAAVVLVVVFAMGRGADGDPAVAILGDDAEPLPPVAAPTTEPLAVAQAQPELAATPIPAATAMPAAPAPTAQTYGIMMAPRAAPAPVAQSAAPAPTAVPQAPPVRSAPPMAAPTPGPAPWSSTRAAPGATTFRDFGRQPAVSTSEDAVSTFSLDTDRTSYYLALNWARSGYEVEPDSVRAEEWVNAFDYGYEQPSDDWGFAITSDVSGHPLDSRKHLARIAFQAPLVADDTPLNVTLVLDASGSMAGGDRVAIARAAAEAIRRSLRAQDRIAVVHFTTDVIEHLTVEHTDPDDPSVEWSIGSLTPNNSTNVQAGLDLGVSLADRVRRERPEVYNYIVLMSDGVANVDATSPFGILESAYDRDSGNPLRLITVGVGIENYNDYLLEQLAQHGNGWYRYLSTVDQARATFSRDNWVALSTPFADQTRAQVTWDPRIVRSWRIVGYENRVTPDQTFVEDRKEFAEIHSGAATTVFYELELHDQALRGGVDEVELGSVELRWVMPDTGQSRGQRAVVSGRPDSRFGVGDPLFRLAAIVGLAADRYGALPHVGSEDYSYLLGELADLKALMADLDGYLYHLDAYHDFYFLLDHMVRSVEAKAPPSKPSGYSP